MKGSNRCSLIAQTKESFRAFAIAGLLSFAFQPSVFGQVNYSSFTTGTFSTNLHNGEKKELVEDLEEKTGYSKIYFDENSKLVIDESAGFRGGSALARKLLQDAVGSADIRFNLVSVNSIAVAFASGDSGIQFDIDAGVNRVTIHKLKIDFGDFDLFFGPNDEAKKAYTVGLVLLHEFAHKLYSVKDEPNSDTDPGVLENTYLNPIRRELGLAERVHYVAKFVRLSFQHYPDSQWRQLTFKLRGKEEVLRWQHDLVGGRREP